MIVKMIQELRKTMKKMQEMFTKDLEELKNKQTKINNIVEGNMEKVKVSILGLLKTGCHLPNALTWEVL